MQDFETIVVDNSGRRLVPSSAASRVIYNDANAGFGGAINQGIRASSTPFVATLNDDAVAHPRWLEAMIAAMERRPRVGMCAAQVRLAGTGLLDSAGMLICRDGSSKQRGHGRPAADFAHEDDALLPSGSAALYRRAMLDEVGLFDESFFLYCEDTDLGLRGQWAGWECVYAPDAVVDHRYSHSAGRASALKAFHVERNRLYLAFKNFPWSVLALAPFYALTRYFWHAALAVQGRGTAAKFVEGHSAWQLLALVLRAHWATLGNLPTLLRARKSMQKRITPRQFRELLDQHAIGPRQVASL
jgi:GT2 family glycosyltransferase